MIALIVRPTRALMPALWLVWIAAFFAIFLCENGNARESKIGDMRMGLRENRFYKHNNNRRSFLRNNLDTAPCKHIGGEASEISCDQTDMTTHREGSSLMHYYREKPLNQAQVTAEKKLLFQRPSDDNSAEEVIKSTEKDMLRLRHTGSKYKKLVKNVNASKTSKNVKLDSKIAERKRKEALRKKTKNEASETKPSRFLANDIVERKSSNAWRRKRRKPRRHNHTKNHTVHWTNLSKLDSRYSLCGVVGVVKDSVIVR